VGFPVFFGIHATGVEKSSIFNGGAGASRERRETALPGFAAGEARWGVRRFTHFSASSFCSCEAVGYSLFFADPVQYQQVSWFSVIAVALQGGRRRHRRVLSVAR